MVKHRDYWTLPGGGIQSGETPEQAVIREVREETGLQIGVKRLLFSHPYSGGVSSWHLAELASEQDAALGHDPELEADGQVLTELAWVPVAGLRNDLQISRLVEALDLSSQLSG